MNVTDAVCLGYTVLQGNHFDRVSSEKSIRIVTQESARTLTLALVTHES